MLKSTAEVAEILNCHTSTLTRACVAAGIEKTLGRYMLTDADIEHLRPFVKPPHRWQAGCTAHLLRVNPGRKKKIKIVSE